MAGLAPSSEPTFPLEVSKGTRSYTRFTQLFEEELNEVREYSFDSNSDSHGICLLGKKKDFLKRFSSFTSLLPFYRSAEAEFESAIQNMQADDYGFKVDWRRNEPYQLTLYIRKTGKLSNFPSLDNWHYPPNELARFLGCPPPFCIALRVGKQIPVCFSAYLDIKMSSPLITLKLPTLIDKLRWSNKVSESILKDLRDVSPNGFKGCLGIDSQGEVLKFDLTGIGLAKIIHFLKRKKVPETRIQDLIGVTRRLHQTRVNYFALKYNSKNQLSWKLYFALTAE